MEHILKIKVINSYNDIAANYYKRLEKKEPSMGIDLILTEDVNLLVNSVRTIYFDIECELVTKKYETCKHHGIKAVRTYIQKEPFMLIANDDISNTPFMMTTGIKVFDKGSHSIYASVRCFADLDRPTIIDHSSYQVYAHSKYFQIVAFDGGPIKVQVVDDFGNQTDDKYYI